MKGLLELLNLVKRQVIPFLEGIVLNFVLLDFPLVLLEFLMMLLVRDFGGAISSLQGVLK